MSGTLLIKNGHVLCPASGRDDTDPLLIIDGVIADPDSKPPSGCPELDAQGALVVPGLVDIHVHLREPGRPDKETIASGTEAALRGGFTTVVAMPNTHPPVDSASTLAWCRQRAAQTARCKVYFTGCLTVGSAGQALTPAAALKRAGAVALTDDGNCVQSADVMRQAVIYAKMVGLPVLDHCQDYSLTDNAIMNEGNVSARLGLPGWPRLAEEIMIARDVLISESTGHPIHCQHVTTAGGADILRQARSRGISITGEITPHHIALCDEVLSTFDANFKVNPPLRTRADIEALVRAFDEGVIDIIATDHAPHCEFEKERELSLAPFGVIGLETCVGVVMTELYHRHGVSLQKIIAALTCNPARLLSLRAGELTPGAPGDVTIIDPNRPWRVDATKFASKARNTPWHGQQLRGCVLATILEGKLVWQLK